MSCSRARETCRPDLEARRWCTLATRTRRDESRGESQDAGHLYPWGRAISERRCLSRGVEVQRRRSAENYIEYSIAPGDAMRRTDAVAEDRMVSLPSLVKVRSSPSTDTDFENQQVGGSEWVASDDTDAWELIDTAPPRCLSILNSSSSSTSERWIKARRSPSFKILNRESCWRSPPTPCKGLRRCRRSPSTTNRPNTTRDSSVRSTSSQRLSLIGPLRRCSIQHSTTFER